MAGIVTLSGLSFWYLPKLGLRAVLFAGLLLISAGFFLLHGIELHASYLDQLWRWLVLSVGIGLITAPTTSAIMSSRSGQQAGCRVGGQRRCP